MKRRMFITVRGKQHEWSFNFDGDPAHLDDWRADGLEVQELGGSVPSWMVGTPLVWPWVALQALRNWMRGLL